MPADVVLYKDARPLQLALLPLLVRFLDTTQPVMLHGKKTIIHVSIHSDDVVGDEVIICFAGTGGG